jgi:hypothetical protein
MTDDYDNELWLSHRSCVSWMDPDRWMRYFSRVQEILDAPITHLDEDDPIRRRYDKHSPIENAEYVTRFGEKDDSRTLFGRVADVDLDFSIWYFRDGIRRTKSINWHGPPGLFDAPQQLDQACRLFDCGNLLLDAFYGYADTRGCQKRKKKEDGAVDLERELVGVFWLTYFNERYVDFFGRDKFKTLGNVAVTLDGGATLRLAETPHGVPDDLRREVEDALGAKSFVRHRDFTVKRPGQFALRFEELRL